MYRGTTRLGDIVINADSDPEGYDMLQDQFAGSEALDQQQDFFSGSGSDIQGGDDGVGVFGAARLRRRIRHGKMTVGGPRVVRFRPFPAFYEDPYGLGLHIRLPKFIRKFQLGRFLGRTAIPLAVGGVGGLLLRRKLPGLLGKVGGLFKGGKQPSPDGGAPDIALPGGTPALAPSGGGPSIPAAPTTTDSAGGQLPADVLAALRGAITPTGGREAPTASQDVATQAEDAGGGQETGDTQSAGLGFGGNLLQSPMGMLMLGGAGLFVLSKVLGGKRRSNPRRRRRRRR